MKMAMDTCRHQKCFISLCSSARRNSYKNELGGTVRTRSYYQKFILSARFLLCACHNWAEELLVLTMMLMITKFVLKGPWRQNMFDWTKRLLWRDNSGTASVSASSSAHGSSGHPPSHLFRCYDDVAGFFVCAVGGRPPKAPPRSVTGWLQEGPWLHVIISLGC